VKTTYDLSGINISSLTLPDEMVSGCLTLLVLVQVMLVYFRHINSPGNGVHPSSTVGTRFAYDLRRRSHTLTMRRGTPAGQYHDTLGRSCSNTVSGSSELGPIHHRVPAMVRDELILLFHDQRHFKSSRRTKNGRPLESIFNAERPHVRIWDCPSSCCRTGRILRIGRRDTCSTLNSIVLLSIKRRGFS
jgi:hypothetical protein